MKTDRKQQRGFTLVEMLVVITIIGILASLLVPAIAMGLRKARESAIAFEIQQMTSAFQEYKNAYNAYPPNFSDPDPARRLTRLNQHLNKRTGNKHREAPATLNAVAGNIDQAEALVLWLGQTRKNIERPFGTTGEFHTFFDFEQERLIPDNDGDGIPQGYVPPHGPKVPYVYFQANTYELPDGMGGKTFARVDGSTLGGAGFARPYISSSGYQGAETLQIICAGFDGNYGHDHPAKRFPDGANMRPTDFDNFTSFSDGRLDKDID